MKLLSKAKNEKGNVLFSLLIVATCVLMIITLIFIDTRMSANKLGKDSAYAYEDDEYYYYYYPTYYPTYTPTPTPSGTPIITIPKKDNTTSGTKLPKTGDWGIVALILATLATGTGAVVAYKKGRDIEGK